MEAKHLPIWRDAHALVRMLHETTRKAPRDLRYSLVQRLLDEAVELCVGIDNANRVSGADRVGYIDEAQRRLVRIDVLLSIATEHRCLSKGAAAQCMDKRDAVGRQAHGWRASTVKTLPSRGQPEPEPST